MKKILTLMVSAAFVLCGVFTGCSDDDDDNSTKVVDTTPTITWAANPDFEPYNIGADDIDLDVVVDAPEGIETFTININTDNSTLNMLLGLASVPTNTDIDIINGDSVSMFQGLGLNCGPDLYGATTAEFNVTDLVSLMVSLAGSSAFTVTLKIDVSDSIGQSASKTATLYTEESSSEEGGE